MSAGVACSARDIELPSALIEPSNSTHLELAAHVPRLKLVIHDLARLEHDRKKIHLDALVGAHPTLVKFAQGDEARRRCGRREGVALPRVEVGETRIVDVAAAGRSDRRMSAAAQTAWAWSFTHVAAVYRWVNSRVNG